MSIWMATSLSSQGSKWCKKARHAASSTVSPNWHLERARYLQRAHSRGSSLPLWYNGHHDVEKLLSLEKSFRAMPGYAPSPVRFLHLGLKPDACLQAFWHPCSPGQVSVYSSQFFLGRFPSLRRRGTHLQAPHLHGRSGRGGCIPKSKSC